MAKVHICLLAILFSVCTGLIGIDNHVAHATNSPSWWSGDCDVNNHPGSSTTPASYYGVNACKPGPVQGGYDKLVSFGAGVRVNEWECVELSFRYMYLMYGIAPYYLSNNAASIVSDYHGTLLAQKTNNGSELPAPGDVLAMSSPHTAIVTALSVNTSGTGTITIMEQNSGWNTTGSRTITVTNKVVGDNVTGWLHGGGRLTQMNNDGSGWNTWDVSSGYKAKGTPLVMWGSGILDIYALNANGGLDQYHQNTATGVWTVYNVLTGTSFARGVTGVLSGTTLNLFVSDTSGYLHHIQKPSSGSWVDYTLSNGGNAGNNIYGDPAVLWTSGSVSVFGVNQSGNLLQYYVPQGQTNWVVYNVLQPASPWTGGVAVFQLGSGTYLHGTNANHRFMEAGATNGNWIMSDISQAAGSSTDVADTPGTMLGINTIDVFPRGNDGSLQQFHLNLITGVWTQYLNVRPSSTSLSNGTSVSMWSNTTEVFSVAN